MTDPNKPSHSLASFLRNAPAASAAATPPAVAMPPAPVPAPPPVETGAPTAVTPGNMVPGATPDAPVVAAASSSATPATPPPASPADAVHEAPTTDAHTAQNTAPAAGVDAPAPAPAPPAAAAAAPGVAPSFTRGERIAARQTPTPRWKWPALVALALLLPLQMLLADRARLAMDPAWRPLLATLCGTLRCTLPAWHEPAAFTMLDREVRPATDAPGVLQIQASFRNDARWAQAWPRLELALSDADGRVIGSRVFEPQDYLGAGALVSDTLAPGQSTRIAFRVREPAAGTAAFNFEFR